MITLPFFYTHAELFHKVVSIYSYLCLPVQETCVPLAFDQPATVTNGIIKIPYM